MFAMCAFQQCSQNRYFASSSAAAPDQMWVRSEREAQTRWVQIAHIPILLVRAKAIHQMATFNCNYFETPQTSWSHEGSQRCGRRLKIPARRATGERRARPSAGRAGGTARDLVGKSTRHCFVCRRRPLPWAVAKKRSRGGGWELFSGCACDRI